MSRFAWLAVAACGGGIVLDEPNLPADTDPASDTLPDTDPGLDSDPPGESDVQEDSDPPAQDTDAASPYDGAVLDIIEPLPASIHLLGDGIPFQARVLDAGGVELPFTDVVWSLREDPGSAYVGLDTTAQVAPGIWTIDVEADLPNGDRLTAAIGGVRAQHRYAGVYVGQLIVSTYIDVQGQSVQTNCIGGAQLQVNLAGTELSGGASCTLTIPLVGTTDLVYTVDGNITEPEVSGDMLLDGLIPIPVAFDGGFPTADDVEAAFAGDALLFTFDGSFSATKVTPYVVP